MQIAASYQVLGRVAHAICSSRYSSLGAAWMYGPRHLGAADEATGGDCAAAIAPLLAGMVLMWLAPVFSKRIQRVLNVARQCPP